MRHTQATDTPITRAMSFLLHPICRLIARTMIAVRIIKITSDHMMPLCQGRN